MMIATGPCGLRRAVYGLCGFSQLVTTDRSMRAAQIALAIFRTFAVLGALWSMGATAQSADPVMDKEILAAEKNLRAVEASNGPDHPSVLRELDSLTGLNQQRGRLDRAIQYQQRALALQEKSTNPEYPDVARRLAVLGKLHKAAGDMDQAEQFFQRSLIALEKSVGVDHADVAVVLVEQAKLYKDQKNYSRAEPLYLRALSIREKRFGPHHGHLYEVLSSLSALHFSQDRYEEAESYQLRAFKIKENDLGSENFELVIDLEVLGQLNLKLGKLSHAEMYFRRVIGLRENQPEKDNLDLIAPLEYLADIYQQLGKTADAEQVLQRRAVIRDLLLKEGKSLVYSFLNERNQTPYSAAERILERTLVILERVLGTDHADVSFVLVEQAFLYKEQKNYNLAESLFMRALSIREKQFDPNDPSVSSMLITIASLFLEQNKDEQALQYAQRALTADEMRLGQNHADLALGLSFLGLINEKLGRFAIAESYYLRLLKIQEKTSGPHHPKVADEMKNLARVYSILGQYAKAEALYSRVVKIYEQNYGPNSSAAYTTLNALANSYIEQGLFTQAETLSQRALALSENLFGQHSPEVATVLNNFALLLARQKRFELVEPLLLRSFKITEDAYSSDHPSVATTLNNLADFYRQVGQYSQAAQYQERALDIQRKSFGPEHDSVALSLNNLGGIYHAQGDLVQAEKFFQLALAAWEKLYGEKHPSVALVLRNLGGVYQDQKNLKSAILYFKRSVELYEQTVRDDHPDLSISLVSLAIAYEAAGAKSAALPVIRRTTEIYRRRILTADNADASKRESSDNSTGFIRHLGLLSATVNPKSSVTDESFQVAQLARSSNIGTTAFQVSARFAAGNSEVAKRIREHQDYAVQARALEDLVIKEISKTTIEHGTAQIRALRTQLGEVKRQLATADAEISKRYPAFKELSRPTPLSVIEGQSLLKSDEALVTYLLSEKKNWVWVIRKNRATWLTLDANQTEIQKLVGSVRAELEKTCEYDGLPCPADLNALHTLYNKLIAPIATEIKGVKNLLIVPDGPLQGLSFPMLVTKPARHAADPYLTDYAKVDWLARQFAVTVLPSTPSLRALRRFAKDGTGQAPFIGFGDPVLEGSEEGAPLRGKRAIRSIALRGGVANVTDIRKLNPLPDTAVELQSIAQSLKAANDSVWLRDRATEQNVKSVDLSQFRTIAFATHGQLGGSVKGASEPGLILTPPNEATEQNDGYLTASEVAQLKLRAEWVLLSACNTAAADGKPGAEGLSGLARAFFYAGGKTLFVSHWPVDSSATVKLTTTMMRLHREKKLSKAEAHRQSMLAMMNLFSSVTPSASAKKSPRRVLLAG